MTNALRKAIMARSRLKNICLKNESTTKWRRYKYERNFCTNLSEKQNLIISVTLM